ncbi:MAG: hypothetical protein US69_C0013G0032 [candidate division TM6 bacterium GW2011_GWF2_38_10]|nr:MAG: hypothetical protein US69_C0013G0032 [candidate division TM6 bacterium GW2011_GWF2_38_10]
MMCKRVTQAIVIFCGIINFFPLSGSKSHDYPGWNVPWGYNYYGNDSSLTMQFKFKTEVLRQLSELEKQRKLATEEKVMMLIDKEIEKLKQELADAGKKRGMADIMARGIAGKDNIEMFRDLTLGDDVVEGIKQGCYARGASAIGDFVGKVTETTVNGVLGEAWKSVSRWVSESCETLHSYLFHHGKRGFRSADVRIWRATVKSCFTGLNGLVSGYMGIESRGRDVTSRMMSFEDGSQEADQEQVMGGLLLMHYADQFNFFADMINDRVGYYNQSKNPEIVFIAKQLGSWLTQVTTMLRSTASIKDLAAKMGVGVRSKIIDEISANIDNLFEKLDRLLITDPKEAPRSESFDLGNAKPTSRYAGMAGYPQSMSGYDAN